MARLSVAPRRPTGWCARAARRLGDPLVAGDVALGFLRAQLLVRRDLRPLAGRGPPDLVVALVHRIRTAAPCGQLEAVRSRDRPRDPSKDSSSRWIASSPRALTWRDPREPVRGRHDSARAWFLAPTNVHPAPRSIGAARSWREGTPSECSSTASTTFARLSSSSWRRAVIGLLPDWQGDRPDPRAPDAKVAGCSPRAGARRAYRGLLWLFPPHAANFS